MKRTNVSTLLLLACLTIPAAFADPIGDLSMQPYRAGWFPNFYKGSGPMTCPETCKVWTGAEREHERSTDIDGQSEQASVCKITGDKDIITKPIDDPASHWIYGNQFDNWPVCNAASLGYGLMRSEYYMCECVQPTDKPCPGPDLIVAQIHDPTYDGATGESVIKVDVANIGGGAAGASKTSLTDPGTGYSLTLATPGIAPGGTTTLEFRFPYWVFDPDAELEAMADASKAIRECKEDNNTLRYFRLG